MEAWNTINTEKYFISNRCVCVCVCLCASKMAQNSPYIQQNVDKKLEAPKPAYHSGLLWKSCSLMNPESLFFYRGPRSIKISPPEGGTNFQLMTQNFTS